MVVDYNIWMPAFEVATLISRYVTRYNSVGAYSNWNLDRMKILSPHVWTLTGIAECSIDLHGISPSTKSSLPLRRQLTGAARRSVRKFSSSNHAQWIHCQDIYIIIYDWVNLDSAKKQQKRTKEKNKMKKEKFSRLDIASQSFAGSVAGLTKPPHFVWSTIYGVHRIPVFLVEYGKTERIDRKEESDSFLSSRVHSYSCLYIGSMCWIMNVGYFLAST
jgi:hypothetical protein